MNDRLSYSSLRAFAKSPNHFLHYKSERSDSPEMAFGRAFHVLILEPHLFQQEIAIIPEVDRRTKLGKETYQEFLDSSNGKQVISSSDFETMERMREAIMKHEAARELLQDTLREIEGSATIHGIPFKGYADALACDYFYAIDLKTTRSADPDDFVRTAYTDEYHLQAAIYRHMFGVTNFYWIAVEKTKPHNVSVFLQDPEAARRAEIRLKDLVTLFKEWDGNARSYSNEVLTLSLPKWA